MPLDSTIPVTRSSMPTLEEYVAEIAQIWESHWLTNMGEKHREFEAELREALRVNAVALFCNGHQALECALEAMGLPYGGEVITTPFTFASTVHAISRKGLVPVFADIDSRRYTLAPECIEHLINPRTCAILPVHVYGNLCDVDAIQEIADKHDLKVIYDAAHAFGVERDGVSAAAFGNAAMFSFHATKVFNSIEGGAVCVKDESLYQVLNHWKNFGISGPEDVDYVGGNAKMNEFCAAMGICNLRHLDEEIDKRRLVDERYREGLDNVPGVVLCDIPSNVRHNFAYMPVVFGDTFGATRDEVFEALKTEGILARKYFYPLASDYACYRSVYASERTPIARDVAARVLTLPMYADLTFEDVDRICAVVRGCAR